MKKLLSVNLIFLCTAFLFAGCVTTQNIKSTFSSIDQLYSQVPEDQSKNVQDAEKNLELANEKLKQDLLNILKYIK